MKFKCDGKILLLVKRNNKPQGCGGWEGTKALP